MLQDKDEETNPQSPVHASIGRYYLSMTHEGDVNKTNKDGRRRPRQTKRFNMKPHSTQYRALRKLMSCLQ